MLVAFMNTSYQIHIYLNVKVSSHAKYVQFLEKQKKASENGDKSKKGSLILDWISEVKKKKMNIDIVCIGV